MKFLLLATLFGIARLPMSAAFVLPDRRMRISFVSAEMDKDRDAATEDDEDNLLSIEAFQKAKSKMEKQTQEPPSFDGYDFRDVIFQKWGGCYDVDFNRVDSFGFRSLYLNVLPFQLGRRPFRHKNEYDYLCHLQAVVEILEKYKQLNYVLYQIDETKKKPIAGRSPIVAVPLRLDLSYEQVEEILGY